MARWCTTPLFLLVALAATATQKAVNVNAFYVPGVRPLELKQGDPVEMKVNAMTSIHTQIPKDYYRMPFCKPTGGPVMASENLGEFLTGNKIQSSPYNINMLTESYCEKLCQIELGMQDAARLRLHIKYGYHNNWIIDNLPSAAVGLNSVTGKKQRHYAGGFPIGFLASDTGAPYIFNHVNIIIDYHKYDKDIEQYRVVGFAIEPISIKHEFQGGYDWDGDATEGWSKKLDTCSPAKHMERESVMLSMPIAPDQKIMYTYDVMWKQCEVACRCPPSRTAGNPPVTTIEQDIT